MAKRRQFSGQETINTLLNWTSDQKTAERLANCVLLIENYSEIDPSHPMGGPDGQKDLICFKNGKKFVAGVYFAQSQKKYSEILKKVNKDFLGVSKNSADGLIFFTNQHLTIGERIRIAKRFENSIIEVYHRERIAAILNSPVGYGIRLEFLGIELNKTEQLSYFAQKDKEITKIQKNVGELLAVVNESGNFSNLSNDKLNEFKETLETIVGDRNSIFVYGNSMIDRLYVPLEQLQEFQKILSEITDDIGVGWGGPKVHSLNVPLRELEEFKELLDEIVGDDLPVMNGPIHKLYVPVNDLEEYNSKLDETIDKLKQIARLKKRNNIN